MYVVYGMKCRKYTKRTHKHKNISMHELWCADFWKKKPSNEISRVNV